MRVTVLLLTAVVMASAVARAGAAPPATAEHSPSSKTSAYKASVSTNDVSVQRKRRPRVLIYRQDYDRGVYPSYFPGSNAVRDCSVRYVQEFRPSGTVIVPDMKCFWRQP